MSLPLWFLLAAFVTEVMAAVVGFGSSTILTPIAALFFDVKTALALVAIFHVIGAIVRFWQFRPSINRHFFIRFGLPAILATLVGATLVHFIPSQSLVLLLGLFLAFLVIYEWTHPRFHLPQTKSLKVASGLLTGFVSGLLGAGGAIRAVSLQAFGLRKEEYVGTSALLAVLVDLTRIPVYLASGYLRDFSWTWLLVLAPIAIAGTLFGLRIIKRFSQRTFRFIVLIAVLAVAVKLINDGISR